MRAPSLLILTATLLASLCDAGAAGPAVARLDESHRAFLRDYCVECHGAEKQKGKLRLDDVSFTLDTVERADRWQKILNQVNSGEMPPEDAKQPGKTAKADFLEALSGTMVTARKTIGDSRGLLTMRRLNRREYKNTLRDLLGVELSVNELPADTGAGTFDTVGSSLFMSSDQFEQYLALGRQAIDEHLTRATPVREARRLRIEAEDYATPRITKNYADRVDAHRRYQAWTAAVEEAAARPENAVVVAAIKAEKKQDPTHLHEEWKRVPGAPSPEQFGFTDAIHAEQQGRRNWLRSAPQQKAYLDHPATKTGAFLTWEDVFANPYQPFNVPGHWPAGRYVIRIRAAATADTPKSRHFLEFGPMLGAVASTHEVTGTTEHPQVIEIPLALTSTSSRGFFLRERGSHDSEEQAHLVFGEALRRNGVGPEFALWIDWIEVADAEDREPARTYVERREVELHANRKIGGTYEGYYKGGAEAAKAFLATGKPQKGIPDEQEAKFRLKVFDQHGPTFKRYLEDPLTKRGSLLTIYQPHPEEVITLPPDQPSGWLRTKHEIEQVPAGDYVLRFRVGALKDAPATRRFLELGARKDKEDFALLRTFQVSGTTDTPQTIEFPVALSAGGPRTFVLREKRDVKQDHDTYEAARKATGLGPPSALWIDWVEWEGPLRRTSPTPVASKHIEVESKTEEIRRMHERSRLMGLERYRQWKDAGGDVARLAEFGFVDKEGAEFHRIVWESNQRWFQQYLDRPLAATGMYLDNTIMQTSEFAVDLPSDTPAGEYTLSVRAGRVAGMPAERCFLSLVEASPVDKDARTFLAAKQVNASPEAPETIDFPFQVRAGGPRKFILMEKRPLKKGDISLAGATRLIQDAKRRDPALWIDWAEWRPATPRQDRALPPLLFAAKEGESEKDHARAVLARFATRAFRGHEPSADFLDKLVGLCERRRAAGESFDSAIRGPLAAILASPGFLYLSEPGEDGRRRTLSDLELASRLSYFLWSAPPDERLLKLAQEARLRDAATMAGEVDRLLDDPRSDGFVRGFVHQWLGLDRLDFFQFDTKQFREFDESTKASARREVYESYAHLLRAKAGLGRLLKSDEVVVDGLLANYYRLEGVSGDAFRAVKLPAGSPRGGLLGMAAILAMGGNGERTSPVERGAWILRKLLHEPPPPAPPNVPQLNRLENRPLTTRERLAAHQEETQCAQCHRKIDPLGFGLENFDAAGRWRTTETSQAKGRPAKTWPIVPSGAFHKGPAFKDYFELRDLIAARPEKFARGHAEALIEYGLGRPFGFLDEELADTMVREAAVRDYSVREFIHALVRSEAFHSK